jgi:GDP-4-dehydro-6-deoxy-D-mannose reductase
MRALVTGAGGFCGQHLLRFLENQEVKVHTLGNRVTSERHHLTRFDDLQKLSEIVRQVKPDYVFHLAGVATAAEHSLYYHINTTFAASLLQALSNTGQSFCPVLLVGTSAEYGLIRETDLPITETTLPQPYSHYGISKLAQTMLGQTLARQGQPVVIARPFNIIGPGMPAHLAAQSFARQIIDCLQGKAEPVIRVGNLNSSRDFLDVTQVVKIYWELIKNPQAYGEVINICSGVGLLMSELLDRLIRLSGKKIEVQVDPLRFKPVDIPLHYGDTTKLNRILGYLPELNLDKTLNSILKD